MDPTAIIVALIGAAALVAPHLITRRAVKAVHSEVRTNHGKSASEYLEMVADVKDLAGTMVRLLEQHTLQDDRNFEEIRKSLEKVTPAA